eukprot:Tbor_TRINITY_DN3916_c0_g1::TRINITY_DN3916_c0_g1_i1::g.757::m.757/K13303/SGK2; serum/glucocorticoid-regulated kinase 2
MSVPDHAGFLQKAGGKLIKQNQTRYFELRGEKLYYFKNKPSRNLDTEPLGFIDCSQVKLIDNPKERFSWTISGPSLTKSYTLFAASEGDKQMWLSKLSDLNPANTQNLKTSADSDEEEEKTVFGKKVGIADFEVICVIGKGSYGLVMQVKKLDTGEIFAMKEMSKAVMERDDLLERTKAEKSILQRINHPFIVTLHYAFQTKDKLYLVLDFLSGGELFFHLSEVGTFDVQRAKFYAAQIGHAIGHLNSLDIIYRDLKPENAVLDKYGNVCLTDFGLAKTNVREANAQTFCGTPEYLAPEFLLGCGHGKAVDWWSLGVLLYEMLFGLPPFYSENVDEMYELILKKPLEFTSECTEEAKDILCQLLDRDPDTRLQNLQSFMEHPFFADLNFDDLISRRIQPPFVPDSNALKNFSPEFTTMRTKLNEEAGTLCHENLAGFTYEGDE